MSGERIVLQGSFQVTAGAAHGAHWVYGAIVDTPPPAAPESPLLYWHLVTDALVAGRTGTDVVIRLRALLESCTRHSPTLARVLEEGLTHNWGAWLPILTLGRGAPDVWQAFTHGFPIDSGEEAAIRDIVGKLLLDGPPGALFDAATLTNPAHRDEYSYPGSCALVKCGLLLRRLRDNGSEGDGMLARWQEVLRQQLRQQPLRPARGFASEWPAFENVVQAVLTAAEWLALPQSWRVVDVARSYANSPADRLTPEQALMAGALYGWTRGYTRVSDKIDDRELRRRLSRTAMAIAVRYTVGSPSNDTDLAPFYATNDGTEEALLADPLVIVERIYEMRVRTHWRATDGLEEEEKTPLREFVRYHVKAIELDGRFETTAA